jgi:hypothetical protein
VTTTDPGQPRGASALAHVSLADLADLHLLLGDGNPRALTAVGAGTSGPVRHKPGLKLLLTRHVVTEKHIVHHSLVALAAAAFAVVPATIPKQKHLEIAT